MNRHHTPAPAPTALLRHFDLLPHLTRAEVEVTNAMLETLVPLADSPHADAPLASLACWLGERTGKPTALRFFRAVAHHDANELPRTRTDAWSSWLEFAPERTRAVLFVDAVILEYWLEGLAGQPVPLARRPFPSTPRDYGFGLYLVVQALEQLTGAGLPPLILPSEEPDPRRLTELLASQRFPLYELVFIAEGHDRRGLVRLFVPAALASAAEAFARSTREADGLASTLTGMGLSDLTVDVPVVLGQTELAPDELRRLEPGDVVLLDRSGLVLDDLGTPGGARLNVGPDVEVACTVGIQRTPTDAGADDDERDDNDGHDEHDADDTEAHWQLTLESISAPLPLAPGNPMNHEPADDERTSLLGQATMTLEARIGAVTMNLGQLARLKPGQVINLDRPVNRPIDLVVNGQHVGTGELVDVEGVLGVRVLRVGRR